MKKSISLIILAVSDGLVVFLSFLAAYWIRDEILPHVFNKYKTMSLFPLSNFIDNFYVVILWTFIFAYEKLYTRRFTFWEEVKALLKGATLSSSIVIIMIFITRKQALFSRTVVILAWLISLLLFPLFRYGSKMLLVKSHLWKKKLLILGVHPTSLLVLKSIKKNKTMGYEVLGFLDDDPQKVGQKFGGTEVLGTFADIEKIAERRVPMDVMIAPSLMPRQKMKDLLFACENISESMWVIPQIGDSITEGVEINVLGDVMALYIKKNLAKPWNILIKTIFDISLSVLLVILLFPLFLIVFLAIRLDSKGPAIFMQERLGKGKRIFNVYKFRSMSMNSDDKLPEYLNNNPKEKAAWEKYKKLKENDPRVTRVGRILRKYSLDELPQVFNVLAGKMSLIGPRPYLEQELKGKDLMRDTISKVKPGITGLWQISGRSELPFEQRLVLDEFYIRNWSLWLDITILLRTLKAWFSSHGAY